MSRPVFLGIVFALVAAAAAAQERFDFAGDSFLAGRDVASSGQVAGDLFAAGEEVTVTAPVAGTAHLAGRLVTLTAEIGDNLYAAGYAVTVSAAVAGNASLAGAEITVAAPVGGNLRAGGSEIALRGAVDGGALLAGDEVTLDAAVAGDATITADEIVFGNAAQVGGSLRLAVPDPDEVNVPASVASADRVEILSIEEAAPAPPREIERAAPRGIAAIVGGVLSGAVIVGLVAAAAVGLAPESVAAMRARALARPFGCLLAGFVSMSALVGAVLVLALTLLGLLIVPAAVLLAAIMIFAGYVAGAYILGVGAWRGAGREIPDNALPKAGLALLGAVLAGLVFLVPVLGWLAWFVLVFIGLGAITAPILARLGRLSRAP